MVLPSRGNDVTLKSEIMLQVNQRLFEKKLISRDIYEAAKIKIVSSSSLVSPSMGRD